MKMKKILAAILLLSMAMALASCGKDEILGFDIDRTPKIAETSWSLSGGIINGEDLNDAYMDVLRKMYNGNVTFTFHEGNKVTYATGNGTREGSYTKDGDTLLMEFEENISYTAYFTTRDGEKVLIAKSGDENALILKKD